MNKRYKNRKEDEHLSAISSEINEMKLMIGEIHQRQIEITLPELKQLHEKISGNGKNGLVAELAVCTEKLQNIESIKRWLASIILTLMLTIGTFIYGYGKLFKQVEIVSDFIMQHVSLK